MMEKYTYDEDNNERLTEVRIRKIWLNEGLMSNNSTFKDCFPEIWVAIQDEVDVEYRGFNMELKNLKQLILSAPEIFILFFYTESPIISGGRRIGQRVYLSNKYTFIDITWLMVLTNLIGCKYQVIQPPYEDFINEFIGEVYF